MSMISNCRLPRWLARASGTLAVLLAASRLFAADLSEAEQAWEEFQKASRPPAVPKEWRATRPTQEEYAAYSKKVKEVLAVTAEQAKVFYTKFPKDPNAPRAKKKEYEALNRLVAMGEQDKQKRLDEVEQARLADPKTTADERFEIKSQKVNRAAMARQAEGMAAFVEELEKGARELVKEFPDQKDAYDLLLMAAQQSEGEKSKKIAEEILKAPKANEAVKERAAAIIKRSEMLGRPLDIQFTAVDERKVNVADLKGKVVLVDFWATWCGPCVAELPNVLAAYEKLNPKGFEIVGISFDQDKDKLTKFVAEKKMPWVQYFDGKGWENKYGREYGITGIPTMWLIDKKGNLRDMNARGGLEGKVEKLLAE